MAKNTPINHVVLQNSCDALAPTPSNKIKTQHHVICADCKRSLPPRKFTYKTTAPRSGRTFARPHYETSKLCEACRRAELLRDLSGKKLQTAMARGEVPFVWGTAQKRKLQALNEKTHAKLVAKTNKGRSEQMTEYHQLASELRQQGLSRDAIAARVKEIRAKRAATNASRAAQLRAYHAARKQKQALDSSLNPTPMGE